MGEAQGGACWDLSATLSGQWCTRLQNYEPCVSCAVDERAASLRHVRKVSLLGLLHFSGAL